MITQYVRRFVLTVLIVVTLCSVSHAAAKPRIIPLLTRATFSAKSADSTWSVPVKSTDGRVVYVLSLDSDVFYTKGQHVGGLELVLRHPHDSADAQNLLARIRNWHGAQPFLFDAADLKNGARDSVYGERRSISIDRLRLVVRIVVLKAEVSRDLAWPGDSYQLDGLDLQIEVDNASDEPQTSVAPQLTTEH